MIPKGLGLFLLIELGMKKAINTTTVEVTFGEEQADVKASDFAIEGLEIKNAAVKQTNNKVVVLTTATQEGNKEYTLTYKGDKVGTFAGISAVVPTSVKISQDTNSFTVGKEYTFKADIGQKVAGVPVTFNVDASGSLNKDHVVEVYTNADGIAEYSYTQYNGGVDTVSVYPTGAPAVRDVAKAYWGKVNPLVVEEVSTSTAVANGEKKVYKVKYTDPTTGAPVANAYLNVALKENVNTPFQNQSKAVITDLATGNSGTPYQSENVYNSFGYIQVKTDAYGQASFTVTGTNTTATPIVFRDGELADQYNTYASDNNGRFETTELFVTSPKVTFAGAQLNHQITITPDANGEAAVGANNGREYKIAVKDKDGKAFAGGVVNVALNEVIDREISTVTSAGIKYNDVDHGQNTVAVTLDSKGEAKFYVYSTKHNDNATPIVWIDQNVDVNSRNGQLENGEPFLIGKLTNFQAERVSKASIAVDKDTVYGADTAKFDFEIQNQSGNPYLTGSARVTYEIVNTGATVLVVENGATDITLQVGGRYTLTRTLTSATDSVLVTASGNGNGSVSISAHATTDTHGYLDAGTASASIVKTNDGVAYGKQITSDVVSVSGTKITLTNGLVLNFDKQNHLYEGKSVDQAYFAGKIGKGDTVTFTKRSAEEGKDTFNIIKDVANAAVTKVEDLTFTDVDLDKGEIEGAITFTKTAGHTYEVFLGETKLTAAGDGSYSLAENTPYASKLKVVATLTAEGTTATTTIDVTDVTNEEELTAINKAAKDKLWTGVTKATFVNAGVTGLADVTDVQLNSIKVALEDAYRLDSDGVLTLDEIQDVVDEVLAP